jgi:phosphate acetyltransferase
MTIDFAQLLERASAAGPIRVVIVLPSSVESLRAAAAVHKRGLATCTLIGSVTELRVLADEAGVGLASLTLIDEPEEENAIRQAIHLCRKAQADVLVNDGAALDALLPALLDRQNGLRADALMSGVSAFELRKPRRLILLTDGIMVVAPDLERRIAIVNNAIHVAHRLGIALPRVALIGATETVTPKSPFTVDAAQITVMAKRKQIEGAIVDGPLGFDNAMSAHAAEVKGIASEVAGRVDVLVAPDIEAGNLLLKTLSSLCRVPMVNTVMGGKVPIVLWSPTEDAQGRLNGIAFGALCS